MIRWIVDASLKARVFVIVIAVALVFMGARELRDAPVDTLPEFGPTAVEIQTEALGLSAAEVEQLVTVPLEQDLLNGVAWVDDIRSKSVPGLSSIKLTFEPGTDPFRARLAVEERMSQAKVALPGVSSPPQILQPLSSTNRVMMIGISSNDLTPIEMSVLARWTIRPRLVGVPGVANVSIWGQRERQLQVLVEPEDLRDRGVSLGQVVETTANALWVSPLTYVEASSPGTSGFIDTPNQRIGIQHILPISSPEDLGQVSVEGSKLRLGDVAQVVEDHQPLIGDAVLGDRTGLLLVIEKFPEANTIDTTRGIEDAIDVLRPGLSGLQFDTEVFRPATSIESGLDDLEVAAVIGLVLAALVLGLLFFQWRTALVALAAIPLSLVAAGYVLTLRGETINVVVVAGLAAAVGLVLNDVVTDTHNVMRRLRQDPEHRGQSIAATILESSLEARAHLMFAALVVVAAAAPAFFLDGLAGEFFPPLALSYVLAAAASIAVALTVTPALSVLLMTAVAPGGDEPPVGRWLEKNYGAVLSRVVSMPRPVLFAALAVVVAIGVGSVPLLNRPSLLPSFKEDQLLIHLDAAPGTSLPEMERMTDAVGGELRAMPGVRDVGGHVGRAIMSDQIVGANSGELWVSLDRDADHDATLSAIHEAVDGYPGLASSVVSYSDEKVAEGETDARHDVTVRVAGADLGILRTKAEDVKQILAGIDGVVDAQVDEPAEEPNIEIKVNLAAAQRHGLEPGGIRRAAATLLQGVEVGSFFEHQKVFQVIVRGTPQTRESLTSIRDLLLETPAGGYVRLADVADVTIGPNLSVIDREGVSRRLDVVADVSGRSRGSVAGDARKALKQVDFPYEYYPTVLTSEDENSWDRLLLFAGFSALAIFLLVQAALGSWRLAALAFVALPAALAGGVLATLADGGDITLGSYAGFLTLLAIAAHGAIGLMSRYLQLGREEGEASKPAWIVRGARERVVPVVMTALATGAGLLPLLLVGRAFGYEMLRPMVVVVLGGLVTSTMLILFVLPALYLLLAPSPEAETARAAQPGVVPVPADPTTGGT